MPELTQRMIDAGATFIDSNGIPTRPDGTPALVENQGILDVIANPQPTPDQMAAALERQGYSREMVPAFLAQDHYVDDSGNTLLGAPDESGMAALYLDANRSPAPPLNWGLGPPYGASEGYDARPPMNPADLDFSGGTAAPANWEDFKGSIATSGGFFTMEDLFRGPVPNAFQQGAGMPSTNNYHLLPPPFQTPGYIMRNGQIININDVNGMYGPWGAGGMGDNPLAMPRWRSGAASGFPAAYSPHITSYGIAGWPGQLGSYATTQSHGY